MIHRLVLPVLVWGLLAGTCVARPNVVLVLADDMGFSDLGCYGSEIPTPHLDRLAANGLRYTRFYSTGRCCPTRASLLTGLYAHQVGLGHMTSTDRGVPGYRGDLAEGCVTIAETLREAGYATYGVGKWHVTSSRKLESPASSWPTRRGFERFEGTLEGAKSYFAPKWMINGTQAVETVPDGFYYTDFVNDTAARYIREHAAAKSDQPLFLYVAHYAPHFPLHAPEEDVERFLSLYATGWDELRKRRHERQLEMGLVSSDWKLSPRDTRSKPWEDVQNRETWARRMAVYAAQVHAMDRGIGRLVKALEDTGKLEDTVFLFLSDNGGCEQNVNRSKPGARIGGPDSYESYRHFWANVSNTPFRRYKRSTHEGGIAAPLVVHWPDGIEQRGALRHDVGHVLDLFPTLVELCDATYPKRRGDRAIPPLEGRSLVPTFGRADAQPREQPLFFEHERNRAVIDGAWKLVAAAKREWELYDLDNDRTELQDLATKRPDVVRRLAASWDDWAERCQVVPRSKSEVSVQSPSRRPNVVWIVADDLSPDLGCYGTKAVETPNIDRLAELGTRYTNAFATSPVCSPSRSALVTGSHQTTIAAHHHRTRRMHPLPGGIPTVMQRFRAAGYHVTNGNVDGKRAKTDFNFEHDLRGLFDGTDWRKRAAGQPFFAQIQIKEPHRPFRRNTDPERPSKLELPPVYPDHPVTRADWADYLASVELLDAKVGRVLAQLDENGVLDDTYVFFLGDHGRPHVWDKQWLYDGGLRVPLIVKRPGKTGAGTVDDRLVSLIDLAPAALTACGLESPQAWQGRDFLSRSAPEREAVFAARDRCGDAFDRIRCVRTKRHAYIRNFEPNRPYRQHSGYKKLQYPVFTLLPVLERRGELNPIQKHFLAATKPAEELYDVRADPFQTQNLVGKPSANEVLAKLRHELDSWIATSNDAGRVAEGDAKYVEQLVIEKRRYFERGMRRNGLDPMIADEDFLDWWSRKLGVTERQD